MNRENSPDSPGGDDPLDQRVDDALRSRYAPPTTMSILEAAGIAAPLGSAHRELEPAPSGAGPLASINPPLWAALGALAALVTMILLSGALTGNAVATPEDARVTEWIENYDNLSSGGPVPACECDPACATFAEHCQKTFSQPVGLADGTAVELLGEPCCDLELGSVSLAAKCDGETVCLIVLLREAAPIIHEKIRRGLSIHRRDFGIFSAFELSALPEPTLLPRLVEN